MANKQKPLKLNLGCGATRLKGYVNVDCEKSCKPDLVLDFIRKPFPWKNGTVSEVVLFHTIEHIEKKWHAPLIQKLWGIMIPGGQLIITYPDFWECANQWKNNTHGKRPFWHATLFGLQGYDSDYHVSAMEPAELGLVLYNNGFKDVSHQPEALEPYNVITVATRAEKQTVIQYTDLLAAHKEPVTLLRR